MLRDAINKKRCKALEIVAGAKGIEKEGTHLFWDSSTELPAYTGLHGKSDVVHLDLVRASRMLSIDERVREGLSGVPM